MAEVVRIAFAVNEDVTALFMATIQFNMDCDGFVELNSYLDSVFYENSTVCQYCLAGPNIITIMNYIPCKKNTTYKFSVMAKTYYEETPLRINDAKVKTNENARDATILSYEAIVDALKKAQQVPITDLNDTISYDVEVPIKTVPTMSIDKYAVKAAIFGQGLAGEVDWDGTLTFDEIFSEIKIGYPVMELVNESVTFAKAVPSPAVISDIFNEIKIDNVVVEGFNANIGFDEVIVNYIFETAKKEYYTMTDLIDTSDGSFKEKSTFTYESTPFVIDSGNACSVLIDTSNIKNVQTIEVEEK